jgi:hypothetical protein
VNITGLLSFTSMRKHLYKIFDELSYVANIRDSEYVAVVVGGVRVVE